MATKSKKILSVLLSVLMVIGCMPIVSLAAGSTITVRSDVTTEDIDAQGVVFDYYIELNGEPMNGTAAGSDGVSYTVSDGVLSLPRDVSADITSLADGTTYSVQRLAYDNEKYALVDASAVSSGVISSKEYYKTVNGETVKIDAETFNAETENGAVLSVSNYIDAQGNTYDEAVTSTLTYVKRSDSVLGITVPDSLEEGEFTYAAESLEMYEISTTGNAYDPITSSGSWIKTYKAGNSYTTVSTTYPGVEAKSKAETPSPNSFPGVKSLAETAALNKLKELQTNGIIEVIGEIESLSGKSVGYTNDLTTGSLSGLEDRIGDLYVFTEVTANEITYEERDVASDKTAAFPVTLKKAPTGEFVINFALDDAVPKACSTAQFELRSASGEVLTAGEDYVLSVEDKSVDLKVINLGYTEYKFSELKAGAYTITQTAGTDGYAIDTTVYEFTVARRDGAVEGSNFDTSYINLSTKALYNDLRKYNLLLTTATLALFTNSGFEFEFTVADQKGDPVEGAEFYMIERDALIDLVGDLIGYGVDTITGLDGESLSQIMEQITSNDWQNVSAEMIVGIIGSIVQLSPAQLESVTIPAILSSTSGEDGVVRFDNGSNMLNALGLLTGLTDVSGADIAKLLKNILGDTIPEEYLPVLDALELLPGEINVHGGVPAVAYALIQAEAPYGYEKNPLLYTIEVNEDGTAVATAGVLLPVIAELVNDRFNLDIFDVLISEEEFNNASDQIKNIFGTFDNYVNIVADSVTDIVDRYFGDYVDTSAIENIRDQINENYEKYDDLSAAVGETIKDINSTIQDDFTRDWIYYNYRHYVDIDITVTDCAGNDTVEAAVTVTDAEGNPVELKEDGTGVNVPFGEYTVTITPYEGYVLAGGEESATVVVDDETKTYSVGALYHVKADALVTAVEPTCTSDGLDTLNCTVCNTVLESSVLPALGHDFTTVVTDPTCTQDGYTTNTCERCGNIEIVDYVDALGHDYTAVVTDPTHETAGYTTYTCTRCGASYIDDIVPALGHNPVLVESAAPTCTQDGYEVYRCQDDSCTYSETIVLPATGHKYVVRSHTEPTCTESGITTYICDKCGDSYDVVAMKLGHSYTVAEIVAPDCENEGYTLLTCTRCDATEKVDVKAPLGHIIRDEVTAPTCTEQGYTTHTCLRCDYVLVDAYTEALGHIYEAKEAAPTCTTDGYTLYTCLRCGDSYTVAGEKATGHTLVTDAAKAPTCTETGLSEGSHCSVCGHIEVLQVVVPANGHSLVLIEPVEPTCTKGGLTAGEKCSVCGVYTYEPVAVPAKGHSYGDWVVDKEASYWCEGSMHRECADCGHVETAVIPIIDDSEISNSFNDGVVCKCCATYEAFHDHKVFGPLVTFVHLILHTLARFIPALREV